MKLEWYISNRYLLAKKQKGTSLIAKVAIFGLILAVMTLITVLSVMNGFHQELRAKILSGISDGYIASYEEFTDYKNIQKTLQKNPNIQATSPYIEEFGLISYKGLSSGISIRGINLAEELKTSTILKQLHSTNFNKKNIIIGKDIAEELHIKIGDKITLITTKISKNIFNSSPRFKRFIVSGIFNSNSEYDGSLAFINLNTAQRLFNLKNQISSVRIKTNNILQADKIINQVEQSLDTEKYYGVSWQTQKRNFITALKLEKQMMAIILSLIVAVAVFNIISMMIMVIKDKKSDIAILRTFGFSAKQITTTFFFLGIKIGAIGIIVGTILGVALAHNIGDVLTVIENIFQIKFFPEDVFYISYFPSEVIAKDIILVVNISFILVLLSSIYPAINASKVNISQTLKEL